MFGFLLSLINPLSQITKQITDMQVRIAAEQNTERRIALEGQLATLQARKEIILKAQSDPFERWVRIGFALPFVLLIWKLIVWDKMLGLGVTDDLSEHLYYILYIILGGYFADSMIRRFKR